MTIISVIPPKKPVGSGWEYVDAYPILGYETHRWRHAGNRLFCISGVEVAEGTLTGEAIPHYHLSVSATSASGQPKRCDALKAKWAIQQFGMADALEDNHSSVIRSFWLPVAENLIGKDCDCKDSEAAITEGDFTWRPLTQENFDRRIKK